MKLFTKWSDFSNDLDQLIYELKVLNDSKNSLNDLSDFEKVKSDFKQVDSKCFNFLKSSIIDDRNTIANLYFNETPTRYNFGNQKKDFTKLKQELFEDIHCKYSILIHINQILKISDLIVNEEKVDILKRQEFDTEQILSLILEKLYEVYGGEYFPISIILLGNGIILKRFGEEIELTKVLENYGFVELIHSKILFARLTINGKMYVEQKLKSYHINYEKIDSNKIEIDRKVDEIISHLTKLGIGQEIIFDEIQELKELYTKLNKKNWGQIVKGKIIDLGLSKLIEADTLKYIYETLTENKLHLPFP